MGLLLRSVRSPSCRFVCSVDRDGLVYRAHTEFRPERFHVAGDLAGAYVHDQRCVSLRLTFCEPFQAGVFARCQRSAFDQPHRLQHSAQMALDMGGKCADNFRDSIAELVRVRGGFCEFHIVRG